MLEEYATSRYVYQEYDRNLLSFHSSLKCGFLRILARAYASHATTEKYQTIVLTP